MIRELNINNLDKDDAYIISITDAGQETCDRMKGWLISQGFNSNNIIVTGYDIKIGRIKR